MARHKVEICGVNTANIKVLKNEEQVDLFKRYQNGDIEAKNELVNGNLKLVLSILRNFQNRVDNMDDLFQVGCIGLIKAIENFDLSHDVKFSTYAVPMILGEVKRHLRDNSSVRIARSIKDLAYKALQTKEHLMNQTEKEPTLQMIASALNVSSYEVANALDALKDTVSMSEPIYNDGGDTIYLSDQLANKENVADLDIRLDLKEALGQLKKKERHILYERYIIGKTQVELADELAISQAQISRLEKSGLENMKKLLK